jgi:hypothetical protein
MGEHRDYRGPYAFREPLIAVRVEDTTLLEVTLRVSSMYWPVSIEYGDEEDAVSLAQSGELLTREAVPYEYAEAGTYEITVTGPRGETDTVSVTVAAA